MRDVCQEASAQLSKFSVDLYFDQRLYFAFKKYRELCEAAETLSEQEVYYLDEAMKDFHTSGLDLPKDQLEKVKDIKKKIAQVGIDFDANIAADKSTILVERDGLDGLRESFINALKNDGDKYVLGCDYPTFIEVMQNCAVEKTRKDLYFAFQNRAYPVNQKSIARLIAYRDELAELLGFESYAALDTHSGMAHNVERVEKFLVDLMAKSEKKEQAEYDLLKSDLPVGIALDADGKFNAWDIAFVKNAYKKKHYQLDERELAEYFPVDTALAGMLSIYEQFLGLKFEETTPDWAWHDEVKLLEVYDAVTHQLIGHLYLDLYPREGKYSHACHLTVRHAINNKRQDVVDVAVVIANFPKATADAPALFKHSDVETFFHEFGHAMHGVLGRTELASFSGTSTKRDFVELPSQMLEEWMYEKDMLTLISAHYKTGNPLPSELIDKKIALKKFDSGFFVRRQGAFSLFSLNCYKAGQHKDLDALNKELADKYSHNVRFEPETHHYAAFGHLNGYGAKYYGYMWSKVFALDIFYEIKKNGLLNPVMGQKYIKAILAHGGAKDPNEMLKDFLGREPNQDAFLDALGLN
ncbi:Zn-dependent oligopeptidase [bacterium]|nr:MAG: Zn-dependent oligopeptidase [bacterium]